MQIEIIQPAIEAVEVLWHQHRWVIELAVAYYIGSNISAALPTPVDSDSKLYHATYNSLHGVFGNLPRIFDWLRFKRS